MSDLAWYVLCTPPQKEFAAEEELRRAGYHVLCPTEIKWRRTARYCKSKVAHPYPIFVRYVFAGFAGQPPWYDIVNMQHVQSVISFDGRPARLPDDAMDYLRRIANEHIPFKSSPNPHKGFRIGDPVQIIDGPFQGHITKVERVDTAVAKRARVIVHLFGTDKSVEIPIASLEAA